MYLSRLSGVLALAALVACALGAVTSRDFELEDRASGTKYVFAHFIVSQSPKDSMQTIFKCHSGWHSRIIRSVRLDQ